MIIIMITISTDWYKCDSQRPCVEYANKIVMFAVLNRWLLPERETEPVLFVGN